MFPATLGDYTLLCQDGGLPNLTAEYLEHASLAEQFDIMGRQSEFDLIAGPNRP